MAINLVSRIKPANIVKIKKVYLPIEYAVKRAAEQNLLRDHRIGLINATSLKELPISDRLIYINQARSLLKTTGENHIPVHPEYEHICVQPS
jgi:hypothetical protein